MAARDLKIQKRPLSDSSPLSKIFASFRTHARLVTTNGRCAKRTIGYSSRSIDSTVNHRSPRRRGGKGGTFNGFLCFSLFLVITSRVAGCWLELPSLGSLDITFGTFGSSDVVSTREVGRFPRSMSLERATPFFYWFRRSIDAPSRVIDASVSLSLRLALIDVASCIAVPWLCFVLFLVCFFFMLIVGTI